MTRVAQNKIAIAKEKEDRAALVLNRKEIATEAKEASKELETQFYLQAGLVGGIWSVAAAFSAFSGAQLVTVLMAGGSAVTVGALHAYNARKQAFLNYTSRIAIKESFEIQRGKSIDGLELIDLEDYLEKTAKTYKSKLSTMFNPRGVAMGVAFGGVFALVVTQSFQSAAARKEDLEPEEHPNTTILNYGDKGRSSNVKELAPSLAP